jgi:hypothetical protein
MRSTLAALPAALIMLLLVLPGAALAHERRTIADGKYDVTVGWDVEPAYVGQKNGAGIRIAQAGSNPPAPVTDADKTLKVQIRQGASTKEFSLRAVFGQPGYYLADIVPTRDGEYQWTFVGSIGSDQINERFDTADGKFDKALPISGIQFPQAVPDPGQQSAAISAAQADAQNARMMALAGIGVGVLGLLAAAALWLTRPRTPLAEPRTASERV